MSQSMSYRTKFPEGGVIFLEGAVSTCMYFIHYGRVGIYSRYGTNEQKLLTTLEAGRFFGEMGMVRGFPRSATAVALLPGTEVATVTWETLTDYFQTEPTKVVLIMQQMAARIGELSDDYIGACGEITRMVYEQSQMEQEIERLRGRGSAQTPTARTAPPTATKPNAATRKALVDSQKDKTARLKKYMDSYRAHAATKYALDPLTGDMLVTT